MRAQTEKKIFSSSLTVFFILLKAHLDIKEYKSQKVQISHPQTIDALL